MKLNDAELKQFDEEGYLFFREFSWKKPGC